MAKERIGILGGTFDPIHTGHIRMAKAAKEQAKLDRVLVMPDRTPPHKTDITPAEDRWRMVCAALAQEDGLEPSRLELDREGTTYTEDTLLALNKENPKAELYFIIGTDTLFQLKNWHNWEHVLKMCTFLVCPRVTSSTAAELAAEQKMLREKGARIQMIDMEVIDISSTDLRGALKTGAATPMLPPVVREYAMAVGCCGAKTRIPEAAEWMPKLFAELSRKRFSHSLGVAYTARNLAVQHNVDADQAEKAALLHDCAKCFPLKEMQEIYRSGDMDVDESILESTSLLHSAAGSVLARTGYGITDSEMLTAIACHTTGRVGMTPLDMVVYLADKIEPTRASYPLLDKVRMLAPFSLEKAMLASMEGTANYVKSKGGKPLHPQTLKTIAWLKTRKENQ